MVITATQFKTNAVITDSICYDTENCNYNFNSYLKDINSSYAFNSKHCFKSSDPSSRAFVASDPFQVLLHLIFPYIGSFIKISA